VKEKTLAELGKIIDQRNDVMKRLMLGVTPTGGPMSENDDLNNLFMLKEKVKHIAQKVSTFHSMHALTGNKD
jgi:hypothetical protein